MTFDPRHKDLTATQFSSQTTSAFPLRQRDRVEDKSRAHHDKMGCPKRIHPFPQLPNVVRFCGEAR